MKKIILAVVLILFISNISIAFENKQKNAQINTTNLFPLSQIEKILGEPAYLKDSSTKVNSVAIIYTCAYSANSKDEKSGKTGVIYLLAENYFTDSSAHKYYIDTYNANKKNGVEVLQKMGDEAYFHTDKENFYFVMARKGYKIIVIKVNKITSKTSLDEFNLFAKNLVEKL